MDLFERRATSRVLVQSPKFLQLKASSTRITTVSAKHKSEIVTEPPAMHAQWHRPPSSSASGCRGDQNFRNWNWSMQGLHRSGEGLDSPGKIPHRATLSR